MRVILEGVRNTPQIPADRRVADQIPADQIPAGRRPAGRLSVDDRSALRGAGVLASAAVLSIGLTLLTGCANQGAGNDDKPKPEKLTASEAGGVYLDAVCPVDDAWGVVDVELDRLRIATGRGAAGDAAGADGGTDTSEADTTGIASALKKLAKESEAAAKELDPARQKWPAKSGDAVSKVRETLRSDAKQAKQLADRDADEIVSYAWKGSEEIGASAGSARAALGLPDDPLSACAQWDEQQAKKKKQAEEDQPEKEQTGKKSDEKSAETDD